MNAPLESTQSAYMRLASINVNEHTEKKANLTYLSWAWAVDQLLRVDPDATWVYGEPVKFGDTMMVFCTVRAFNKPMTAQLPVMDHRNKAIPNPDAFQVNTAMQRCLAKAIALHGLGLYIYAGEDLPEGYEKATPAKEPNKHTPVNASMQGVTIPETIMEELRFLGAELVDLVEAKNDPSAARDKLDGSRVGEDDEPVIGDYLLALWQILSPNSKTRTALNKEKQRRLEAAKATNLAGAI